MENFKKIKNSVEALLFASESPLRKEHLADIIGCSSGVIERVVSSLKEEYEESDRAFTIRVVNNGYKLYTRSEYSELIKKLKGKHELYLSSAALTTLAVITYRQPVTRKEVEQIRGVDCSGVINTLQDSGLIKVIGKGDGFGHPYLYGTTDKFFEVFQIESLEELPEVKDENSAFFGESGNKFKT